MYMPMKSTFIKGKAKRCQLEKVEVLRKLNRGMVTAVVGSLSGVNELTVNFL